ncbi:MAG: FKBP-type peptidyl-prolyl cis-trans isomerase [Polyangiaceae bacterium]
MSDVIADGMIVGYRFEMARADDGEVIGHTDEDDVSYYLHGAENIPPGLEKALTGKKVGDKFEVVVAPEEAFGEKEDVEPLAVPLDQVEEADDIEVGANVMVESPDGEVHMLFVAGVDDDNMYLDPNHPLAGVRLKFDVEILSVRAATQLEKDHGHPHEGAAADHEH